MSKDEKRPIILIFLLCVQLALAQSPGGAAEQCSFWEVHHQRMEERPKLERELQRYEKQILPLLASQSTYRSNAEILHTLPVVFHLATAGDPPGIGRNIADDRIEAQIQWLNDCFAGANPGFGLAPGRWGDVFVSANIQFCLAATDPNGETTNGIIRYPRSVNGSNQIDQFQRDIQWDPLKYLNIYIVPLEGNLLGYAYLPSPSNIGSWYDGIVVDYETIGSPATGQGGKTLVHEVGHYLGLYHIWENSGGGGCQRDDGIEDTPVSAAASNFSGCIFGHYPTGPSSCGSEQMYVNFMDYAADDCQIAFTGGQVAVMRAVLEGELTALGWGSRKSLLDGVETVCRPEDIAGKQFDLGLHSVLAPVGLSCPGVTISPQVKLINSGTESIESYRISYQIDDGPFRQRDFSTAISPGAVVLITLDDFIAPQKAYRFFVSVEAAVDQNFKNDFTQQQLHIATPGSGEVYEDFEASAFNPTQEGIIRVNYGQDEVSWERVSGSAFGSGNRSVRMENYDQSTKGTRDALMLPPISLRDIPGASLRFDLAYARYNPEIEILDDRLQILLSTDCGVSFEHELFSGSGTQLETAPPRTLSFVPQPGEWKSVEIDLSSFGSEEAVIIAFISHSEGGNNLYLDNIAVNASCVLDVSLQSRDASCAASCDGELSVVVGQNAGTPHFAWSDAAAGNDGHTASGLCPGTYRVTVSDAVCQTVVEGHITQPESFSLAISTSDESAVNANDGTARVWVEGAAGPYQYQWSNGATGDQVDQLSPGSYTVTATNAHHCQVEQSFDILSYACSPLVADLIIEEVRCHGAANGQARLALTPDTEGAEVRWSNGTSGPEALDLTAGHYNVSVTDAFGCSTSLSFTVAEPEILHLDFSVTDQTIVDEHNGTVSAQVSGGTAPYTYFWSNLSTGSEISGLAPDSYQLTITDAQGCTLNGSVDIKPVDCSGFGLELSQPKPVSCSASCDAQLQLSMFGGKGEAAIIWSNGSEDSTLSNLCAGTYSVTVSDEQNCQLNKSVVVDEPPALNLVAEATNESKFESKDGTASVEASGGSILPEGYRYQWSSGATGPAIFDLAPDTYDVTVTDGNHCTAVSQIEIAPFICAPFDPKVELKPTLCFGECSGAAAVVLPPDAADYRFEWTTGATTQKVLGLCSGPQEVVITDTFNCRIRKSITIPETERLQLSVDVQGETAFGAKDGIVNVSVTGGTGAYSYRWSNGYSGASQNNLVPGSYGMTVTDSNGCTDRRNFIVEPYVCAPRSVSVHSTPTLCVGSCDGSAELILPDNEVSMQAQWSHEATGLKVSGLCAGSYSVTLTDAFNCSIIRELSVEEAIPLTLNITTQNETKLEASDGFATAAVTGGAAPYSFRWSNGKEGEQVGPLSPGAYSVTVTDSQGCSTSASLTVSAYSCPPFIYQILILPPACHEACDGQATLDINDPEQYSIRWSDGQAGVSAAGLCAGTYSVSISDQNNCYSMHTLQLVGPDPIALSIEASNGDCRQKAVAVANASGGALPYAFQWSNGTTGKTNEELENGRYYLSVTDALGCLRVDSIQIENPFELITLESEVVPINCYQDTSGAIDIRILTGEEPLRFEWNTGAATSSLSGLGAGTYQLKITDNNNCAIAQSFVLTEPDSLGLTLRVRADEEQRRGSIESELAGGVGPFSYKWNTGAQSVNLVDVPFGLYSISVTDANGCEASAEIMLGTTALRQMPELESLSIFPNPGHGSVHLRAVFSRPGPVRVQLFDVLGRKWLERETAGDAIRWDFELEHLPKGNYLLQLSNGRGSIYKVLVLQ